MSAAGAEGREKNRQLQGWAKQRPLTSRRVETRETVAEPNYSRPTLMHYGHVVARGRRGAKVRVGGSKPAMGQRKVERRVKLRARFAAIKADRRRLERARTTEASGRAAEALERRWMGLRRRAG